MNPELQAVGDSIYRGVCELIKKNQNKRQFGTEGLGVAATAALKASILHLYIAIRLSFDAVDLPPEQIVMVWLATNKKFIKNLPDLYNAAAEEIEKIMANPQ